MNVTNFIPKMLPLDRDKLNMNLLIESLLKSERSMNTLSTKIQSGLFDADFLLYPLLTQEAAASTRIENTQVTIDDIYEVQSETKKSNQDINEALNYIEAIRYGKEMIDYTSQFSKTLIKEMHKILMSGNVRGHNKRPGEFKNIENFIGTKKATRKTAEFIPPGPEHTDSLIENLLNYINSDEDDTLILYKTSIIHCQFETIHPFLDGNGRIGRVLIPLFLYYKKIIPEPFFFLSATLEKNRFEYYQRLNDTRWPDDWESWVVFFLKSAEEQANSNIEIANKIEEYYTKGINILKSKHTHHQVEDFMKSVCINPIFKVKNISEKSGVNYQSCLAYTKTLEENEMIFPNNKQRNITYYNYGILNILR